MAHSRFIKDSGLTVRMTTVMFLLGALFVAIVVSLIYIFPPQYAPLIGLAGIGEEMGDVGMAIQRAEDKTAQMQARAGAIDELIASGALDDVTSTGPSDDITRELDSMSSASDVEAELARLKGSTQPQAIEAAEDGGDILQAEPAAQPVTEATGESEGEARP